MDALLLKFTKIEQAIESAGFDHLTKRVDDIATKQTIVELAIEDKLKVFSSETDSKVVNCELRGEEKLNELGDKCSQAIDKALAIEIRLNEWDSQWPSLGEGWATKTNKRNQRKLSQAAQSSHAAGVAFAEQFKDKPSDTIVLLGDSLTRGVGEKLELQSNMVSTICRPGAHIDDITAEVIKMPKKEDRHLVLMVGTNDVESEGSVAILLKYKALIGESLKLSNRKVTVVGILRRTDLSDFHNSRRIGVNIELKQWCVEMKVEFIDYQPANSRLARDGLHLNHLGQDELGRIIFQHCRPFLG